MRKCFKSQVKERQNTSIETWIRAAKLSLKNPIRSEDMDKMQTKFHEVECSTSQLIITQYHIYIYI